MMTCGRRGTDVFPVGKPGEPMGIEGAVGVVG